MQSFLDVVLPPLLLLAVGVILCGVTAIFAMARVRLWDAERTRIDGARTALGSARDALAAVISDPGLGTAARDQAVTAYEAITTAITKENDYQ